MHQYIYITSGEKEDKTHPDNEVVNQPFPPYIRPAVQKLPFTCPVVPTAGFDPEVMEQADMEEKEKKLNHT